MLGDADQEQIEEVALLLGRLAAGEQQVEVLGEAQPAHQVAAEVVSSHFDPVGVGLADVADRGRGLTDLHIPATLRIASVIVKAGARLATIDTRHGTMLNS